MDDDEYLDIPEFFINHQRNFDFDEDNQHENTTTYCSTMSDFDKSFLLGGILMIMAFVLIALGLGLIFYLVFTQI